ncbi:MAG: prepilin-type N-terminal cleavage/methylation domain-containing protein [Acidobacteria bacterium]|nr:prepilin-type N-terminal cleavage/methylation domain-containing protein [Acidobacteriota bacterium]MBS1865354.1 prepilin-type N-terminal cleavage/methylation domain-containing protein [Acidobacteriota bacterium]
MKPEKKAHKNGFSLLEAVVVVAIISILVATSVIGIQQLLSSSRSDAAANTVVSQLRAARQLAISRRHNVQVTVNTSVAAPNFAPSISYVEMATGALTEALPAVVTVPLPPNTNFLLQPGQGDTPMGFGNTSAVYIGGVSGGPATMFFSTTGAFMSGNAPINGTFFVGIDGNPGSARAVTLLGSTGRVRTYYWAGVSTQNPTGWRE